MCTQHPSGHPGAAVPYWKSQALTEKANSRGSGDQGSVFTPDPLECPSWAGPPPLASVFQLQEWDGQMQMNAAHSFHQSDGYSSPVVTRTTGMKKGDRRDSGFKWKGNAN